MYGKEDLISVAKLYYLQNLTHQEIAEKRNLSRSQVTRMLKAAKDSGIVRISIGEEKPLVVSENITTEMETRFNLKKAVIVHASENDNENSLVAVSRQAAAYLDSVLKSGDIVGIGWGMCVAGMVKQYFPTTRHDVLFAPVLGGVDERDFIFNLPELSRLMAEKSGGIYASLYAPAIVDSVETRKILMADSSIHKTVDLWDQLDVLVIGIGAMKSKMPQVLKRYLQQNALSLDQWKIACDLCFNFLDQDGKPISMLLDDHKIGIELEKIRKTPLTIAIALGPLKIPAIHAALWSGCIDVLVTTEETAAAVLDFGIKEA